MCRTEQGEDDWYAVSIFQPVRFKGSCVMNTKNIFHWQHIRLEDTVNLKKSWSQPKLKTTSRPQNNFTGDSLAKLIILDCTWKATYMTTILHNIRHLNIFHISLHMLGIYINRNYKTHICQVKFYVGLIVHVKTFVDWNLILELCTDKYQRNVREDILIPTSIIKYTFPSYLCCVVFGILNPLKS